MSDEVYYYDIASDGRSAIRGSDVYTMRQMFQLIEDHPPYCPCSRSDARSKFNRASWRWDMASGHPALQDYSRGPEYPTGGHNGN